MESVRKLTVRKKGIIVQIDPLPIAKKLFSMGIMPGIHIELIRKGPFGSTYYCLIDNRQRIALRKIEAEAIIVD